MGGGSEFGVRIGILAPDERHARSIRGALAGMTDAQHAQRTRDALAGWRT